MTKNQLEFWSLQETKRNNERVWRENARHNQAAERETNRSNLAREDQQRRELVETNRSNLERESQNRRSLAEQRRHSLAVEIESQRSNLATEANNRFANNTNLILGLGKLANERTNLSIQRQNAATQAASVYNQGRSTSETIRSNMAKESLTRNQQMEQMRSNLAQEKLSSERNQLTSVANYNNYRALEVQRERNLMDNAYKYSALAEQAAYNEASLILQAGRTAVGTATDLLKVGAMKQRKGVMK